MRHLRRLRNRGSCPVSTGVSGGGSSSVSQVGFTPARVSGGFLRALLAYLEWACSALVRHWWRSLDCSFRYWLVAAAAGLGP